MNRFVSIALTLIFVTIWALPVAAQKPSGSQNTGPSEHAFLSGLENWSLDFRQLGRSGGVLEYVPAGEDIESWENLISIHIQPSLVHIEPQQYRDLHVQSFVGNCRSPERNDSSGALPDGTPYVQVEMTCRMRNPGNQGSVVIHEYEIATWRYVRTGNSMYMLQRAWHGTRREWNDFRRENRNFRREWNGELNHISICDFADPDLVCPAVGIEAPGYADAFIAQRTEEINNDQMPTDIIHMMALTDTRGPMSEDEVRILYQRQLARLSVRPVENQLSVSRVQSLPMGEHNWSDPRETRRIAEQIGQAIFGGVPATFSADYQNDLPASEAERMADRVLIANQFFNIYQTIELASDRSPDFEIELSFADYRAAP